MARREIKFYAINNISQATQKDSLYAVKGTSESAFKLYVNDLDGNLVPLLANASDVITEIVSSDNSIEITGTGTKDLKVSAALQNLINSALQSGDPISSLLNDTGYITLSDLPNFNPSEYDLEDFTNTSLNPFIRESDAGVQSVTGTAVNNTDPLNPIVNIPEVEPETFTTDFNYNLPVGKSLGKLTGTGVYPAIGLTQEEFLREIANEYINAVFNSFSITSQATTVEVGTTLSEDRIFTWTMTLNNAIIPTINIFDNTANAVLVNTPNDNLQVQAITTILLNANNATQSWRGIGVNTNGANINSNNFVVTSQFYRYWGAVGSTPTNPLDGTVNRTYVSSLNKAFKTNGANSFTLVTGTTNNKFLVILPPGVTITSVIDTGNLNLNITSSYVLSTITIKDAGGTDRVFNQYLFNPDNAYGVSTNHLITTN